MSSPLTILTQAAVELGGPCVDANDIEWALNVPAGSSLIHWLLDQCNVSGDREPENGEFLKEIGVALRSIALENDESKILKHSAKEVESAGDRSDDTVHAPLMYDPPSHLRKHAGYIDNDTRLLEAQNIASKSRLNQIKRATQTAQTTISSLQATIQQQDAAIRRAQEQLAELSILADSTLASGADTALTLLNTLSLAQESKTWQKTENPISNASLQSPTRVLTNLANFRTSLVENRQSDLAHLPLQPQKELLEESRDLFRALDTLSRDERLEESAYALELRKLHEALGQEENIHGFLSRQDVDDSEQQSSIRPLIEKAWSSDHATRLDAEHAILTSAINEHETTLLPALNNLHIQLSAREQAVRSAEALIGAFGIEVEGISGLEYHSTRDIAQDAINDPLGEGHLAQKIKSLVSQHLDEHKSDTLIMEKSDIIAELRCLQESIDAKIGAKDPWGEIQQIKEKLSLLNVGHHRLQSLLYGVDGVQTNTSMPFRRTMTIGNLEQRAQEAVARTELGVRQGEEFDDLLASKRTQRKLDEFIDRRIAGPK